MVLWLSVTTGRLALLSAELAGKLILIRKGIVDFRDKFGQRLQSDTNVLIDVSTRDKKVRDLAEDLNRQLTVLRKEHNRYENGDRELKEAVTNISHDLRTPLTSICGYLELLGDEEVSPAGREYLSAVEERTGALKSLTEELFRYTIVTGETEELIREAVDVGRVLEGSLGAYYAVLKQKGITPEIIMPENKVERLLNHVSIIKLIINLIDVL